MSEQQKGKPFVFKITTTGRKVLAACIDSDKRLDVVRVAFGKGQVPEDVDLADQHELVDYVADGTIADRRHSGERLMMAAQYSNFYHPEVPTAYFSEFIIYAKDPDTDRTVDLIYATLGDYTQPVPKYEPDMPPVSFSYPITIVLSSDASVTISAPAGVVTYDELVNLQQHIDAVFPADGWEADEDTEGAYPYHCDIAMERVTTRTVPQITILPASAQAADACGFAYFAQGITGAVRVYAERVPDEPISVSMMLFSNPPYVRGDGSGGGGGTILTSNDLLDEEETERDMRNILLTGRKDPEE